MDDSHDIVSLAACRLAEELPLPTLQIVARKLRESDGITAAKARMTDLPHPQYRVLATNFLKRCEHATPQPSVQAIALALLTAGLSEKRNQAAQSVELVWTGPDAEVVPFRRTEQAILQVLDSAQERITLVSYAVYRIQNVCKALVRAASRGVRITVIVETPNKIDGQSEYSTLAALGQEVASCSTVYYWPQANRQCHGEKPGILHVKCVVADSRWLFLSSANLTEYAFSINMELGVLLTGGNLPMQVEANFDRLIAASVLEPI